MAYLVPRRILGLGFLAALALVLARPAAAEIHRFEPHQAGARNLGVWRLTHDPAIRDEANYHNTQCWSPNGRYTCYTHWGGDDGRGGKATAEVHVVDLMTGEDRLVDKGVNPRWANRSNRLVYCHRTGDGSPPHETGTQLIRYDADTGEKVVITHGVEVPSALDSTDTWIYGTRRFRGQDPQYVTVRVRNAAASRPEVIRGAPNQHFRINVNPWYPVIMVRTFRGREKNVLAEVPKDFSWTHEAWKVGDRTVARAQATRAPEASMELVHLYDGVIAREKWLRGRKVSRVDLNEQGRPIRLQEFEGGELKKRVYKAPDGLLISEEFYGPDGFKTEYVTYYTRAGRRGQEADHWWYERGRPVKRTGRGGRVVFDETRGGR